MKTLPQGMLINMAGKGRYLNPDAPEKLIKYVTRMDGKQQDDLVAWGGLGITEYQDIDSIPIYDTFIASMETSKF